MATILRFDGQVINWSRVVEGPRQPFPNAAAIHEYRAQLEIESLEFREVRIWVGDDAKVLNKLDPGDPETEKIVKRCVVGYIENWCASGDLGDSRVHTIDSYKLQQLLEQVLQHS
jgi:hypothetical protein